MASLGQDIKRHMRHQAKRALSRFLPARLYVALRARTAVPHFPEHVFLEPTTQCNLKCLHCGRTYWKERDQARDLDLGLYKRTVDQLRDCGVSSITIQGLGEPLLHPDLFEMIEYAQDRGIYTRFNTNFTLLTDEAAERLVKANHSEVMVSIESIEPKLFADIRRKGDLQTVLDNMRRLADTKKRLGSDKPVIFVNAVLMKATLHLIHDLFNEMKDIGVQQLNFHGFNTDGIPERARLRDGTRMVDNSLALLGEEEIERITQEILGMSDDELPVTINGDLGGRGSSHIQTSATKTCTELWEAPYIDSAGRVTPCCWLPDGDIMSLGDLNESTFEEIWYGEAYDTLRRQHIENRHPDVCKGCQQLTHVLIDDARASANGEATDVYENYFVGRPPDHVRTDRKKPAHE